MNKLSGLSFIIPTYNEEEAISETISRVVEVLTATDIPFEIIVVDDGSTDGTSVLLGQAKLDSLVTLRNPANSGYGAAIKRGLLEANYDWIGIVDADGSYDIEAIPLLILEAEKGFDMVVGNRKNIRSMDSWIKSIFRGLMRSIVWLLVDKKISDINSGFRIIRKSSVKEFLPFLCSTFSFTTSLSIFFAERGLFVSDVPTKYRERKGQSKVRHVRDSIRAFQMILQGITYFNPLKSFVFLVALMVVFVCIPAMILAMARMPTLSAYYNVFGSVVALLFCLGVLVDIVRISGMRANIKQSKDTD